MRLMLSLFLGSLFLSCGDAPQSNLKLKGKVITTSIPSFLSSNEKLMVEGQLSDEDFKEAVFQVLDAYAPLSEEKSARMFLRLPIDPSKPGRISELDLTDEFETRKEIVEKLWGVEVPNAHATHDVQGKRWFISIYGGLARQQGMEMESFTLILCHEIGHFFGGFPLYLISPFTGVYALPLSSEGQADYYAAQVCLRRVWGDLDNFQNKYGISYRSLLEAEGVEKCDEVYSYKHDRQLCYKSLYAGLVAGRFWYRQNQEGDVEPKISTPSSKEVFETNQFHYPLPQCRLDTYVQGALCPTKFIEHDLFSENNISYDLLSIPGLDHPEGPDSILARDISRKQTCHEEHFLAGKRPRCWFHPEYYSDSLYSPF